MIQEIIRQYDFNLAYATKLVEDLDKEQMTWIPFPGFENHPAFTLGHLVTGSAMMVEDLGGIKNLPGGWEEIFVRTGPGDPRFPAENKNLYPEKNKLLFELERQHQHVKNILLSSDS